MPPHITALKIKACNGIKKKKSRTGKIAQNVKTVATKPGNLGSISGLSSTSWEEEMDSPVVL